MVLSDKQTFTTMKNIFRISFALLFACSTITLISCTEDEKVDPEAKTGSIIIEYDNVVGDRNLKLNTDNYTNAAGETFTISMMNYYISNIKLLKSDGSSYVVPKDSSYFLIRESDVKSQEVKLNNVPVGDYTGITFMIGVDSLKSASDPAQRTGVLDIANPDAMYWAWNSGYIFLKLEGASPSSTTANGKYNYHIGLFGGLTSKTINNLKTVNIDFKGKKASVTASLSPQVHLLADAMKIFNGPTQLSIAKNAAVMSTPYSENIANNYQSMFSLDHIHGN